MSQIEKFNKRLEKTKRIPKKEKKEIIDEKPIVQEPTIKKPIVERRKIMSVKSSTDRLLDLVFEGATIQELKQKLRLNDYQLSLKLNSLKNNGYLIDKKYNDIIGTKLYLHQNLGKNRSSNNIRIYTDGFVIRFLVISDTHFGNIGERFDIIGELYDYAIRNNIYSILHLGDLIEGYNCEINNTDELKMIDPLETVKYIATNYPKDSSIVNYILLGNHDFRTIATHGFDIAVALEKARLDMEFLGYNNATIQMNKDCIGLQHPTLMKDNATYDIDFVRYHKGSNPAICLRGHNHYSFFYESIISGQPVLCAPALYDNNSQKPMGAWDMTLYFDKQGKIDNIELLSLEVEPRVKPLTRIIHEINR